MDEEKVHQLRSMLPATGVGAGAILLLFLIGNVFFETPFEATRPPERPFAEELRRDGAIEARLWQDPLRALSDFLEFRHENGNGAWDQYPEELAELLGIRDRQRLQRDRNAGGGVSGPHKIAVIGVIVDGEWTSEASESRLRQRIAVVSALAQRGLIPEGDGSLRFLLHSDGRKIFPLAYELFRFDPFGEGAQHPFERTPEELGGNLAGAVVAWLDEGIIRFPRGMEGLAGRGPVEQASSVLASLVGASRLAAPLPSNLEFIVIGPASSTLLGDTADELVYMAANDGHAPRRVLAAASQGETALAPEEAERLVDVVNAYLDTPLLEVDRLELLRQLRDPIPAPEAYASLADLRQFEESIAALLRGLGIDDSDPDWEEYVASVFARRGPTLLGLPADRVESEARSYLLEAANSYLDDGMSADALDDIKKGIGDALHKLQGSSSSSVARIWPLLNNLSHADSDDNWPATAIGLWLLEDGGGGQLDLLGGRPANEPQALADAISRRVRVYSSQATAPLALTRISARSRNGGNGGSDELVSVVSRPPRFHTAVASDQALAAAMVEELGRRGLDVIPRPERRVPRDHVVLISEWDTLYGRSLPLMFEVELERRAAADARRYELLYQRRLNGRTEAPENVHRFSYLRGLEGVAPRHTPGRDSHDAEYGSPAFAVTAAGLRPGGGDERARLARLEEAEGPGQLDMIRRIGDQVAQLDRELQDRGHGRIRAIGVLGSDFHDKLMVLQALRDRFSDVLFFTTDLDARFVHPRFFQWTRNLLVASSYGLELAPELQCRVPPFRQSYSSSTFAALLAALQEVNPQPPRTENGVPTQPCEPVLHANQLEELRPRLFEIGRGLAVPLGAVGDRTAIHPSPPDPGWLARRVLKFALPILFVLFWLLSKPGARLLAARLGSAGRSEAAWRWRLRAALTAAPSLVLVFAWYVALQDARTGGEPLLWLSGVSAWPSELLRLLAAAVGVLLLLRALWELARDEAAGRTFFGDPPRPGSTAERAQTAWRLRLLWQRLVPLASFRQWPSKHTDAADLWWNYEAFGRPARRFCRLVVPLLVIGLGLLYLEFFFGVPNAPVRSDTARWTHWVTLPLATLVLLVLALVVFDATRLCARFVDALSGKDSARLPDTPETQKLAASHGASVADLGDVLAMRIIADRTDAVGRLLLYPFLVTAIFVVARSQLFDAWSWPWPVTLLIAAILVILLAGAVRLQRSARRARQATVRRLEELRMRRSAAAKEPGLTERQVELMISEVKSLQKGAFAGWTANPVFGALLLPFGGAGALWLVDLLVQFGL